MAAAKDGRRALLAMVHIGKKDLRLDDAVYRAVLQRMFGVSSAAELTIPQLEGVLRNFEEKGWRRTRKPERTPRAGRASPNQLGMIRGIWGDLAAAGKVREASERGLRSFVKRLTGVDAVIWLTPQEAGKVIEGLKAWREREQHQAAFDGGKERR